ANQVVLGIGYKERVARQRAALRMIERCRAEIAIALASGARPNGVEQLSLRRGDHDPIVVAVADEQSLAGFVSQNLAGKAQRRRLLLRALQRQLQRPLVEQAPAAVRR